jgi:hypothetical protein
MTTPVHAYPIGQPPTPLEPGVIPGLPLDHQAFDVDEDTSNRPAQSDEPTDLGRLLEELNTELLPQEEAWDIPTRPGWSARFRTDITDADMKQARKSARVKGTRRGADGEPEVDELKVGRILLAKYNTGLFHHGKLVEDEQGPVTFRSGVMFAMYKVSTAGDVVAKLYGTDGAVISAGRVLLDASGWLDDPDSAGAAADPTDG